MRIEHNPAARRFVARLPEGTAVLDYEMTSKDVMDVLSTQVPSGGRGRGVGGALVEAALTHARQNNLRVIPSCWYVGTWVEQHPEFRSILVD